MKIIKLENDKFDISECEQLTDELKAMGYKELIDTPQPSSTNPYEIFSFGYMYDQDKDIYVKKYNGFISKSKINMDIANARQYLSYSDYIITKFSEGNIILNNPDLPESEKKQIREDLARYDLNLILKERQEYRNRIRELRKLLENA